MATYYALYDNNYTTVRLRTDKSKGYNDVREFKKEVDAWLIENNIRHFYVGEETAYIDNLVTFKYTIRCTNEKDAAFVGLRWA